MTGYDILLMMFLAIAIVFNLLGTIGLHRFPDVYTRLHAATKCTTFGTIFVAVAVLLLGIFRALDDEDKEHLILSIHAFVALLAILVTNPTGAHALARAAHRGGVKPAQAVVDELAEADIDD